MKFWSLLAAALALTTLAHADQPSAVSVCELRQNPNQFNGKDVSVRGFVDLAFENFTLNSKDCDRYPGIWLMFGGDVATPTPSTWNDVSRKPGSVLKCFGRTFPLQKDEAFTTLYNSITAKDEKTYEPTYRATATLVGTFFAAPHRRDLSGREYPSGYGHMGCCSLLIITAVYDVQLAPFASPTVLGTVVDEGGRPLGGVTVVNTHSFRPNSVRATTDERGQFSLTPVGRILAIRDKNYSPATLVLGRDETDVGFKLQPSGSNNWNISNCRTDGAIGRDFRFSTPKHVHIQRSKEFGTLIRVISYGNDVAPPEVSSELMIVGTTSKVPTNLAERPVTGFSLIQSVDFSQRWIKESNGEVEGIDSRGVWEKGQLWRELSLRGRDWASYRTTNKEAAQFFDRIMDSLCVAFPGRDNNSR